MEDTINTTTNNTSAFSKEDVAIINAAFRLLEIVIQHRSYKRRRGRELFTKGAIQAAANALAPLRPSVPGTDPARVAALFARDQGIAGAAVKYAIQQIKHAKQDMWDKIRTIELSDAELKSLS